MVTNALWYVINTTIHNSQRQESICIRNTTHYIFTSSFKFILHPYPRISNTCHPKDNIDNTRRETVTGHTPPTHVKYD